MRKGEATRQAILTHAARLGTQVGLEGLTIGRLADELELSKSGLFAHFRSKEALQLATMEFAATKFVDAVVRPAFAEPRGEPRFRALFENWMSWSLSSELAEGCFFVGAAAELDGRTGPLRARLVQLQKDWLDALAQVARGATDEGHFRAGLEPAQLAFEVHGIMLVAHHCQHLLRHPDALDRAERAFTALLERAAAAPLHPRSEER